MFLNTHNRYSGSIVLVIWDTFTKSTLCVPHFFCSLWSTHKNVENYEKKLLDISAVSYNAAHKITIELQKSNDSVTVTSACLYRQLMQYQARKKNTNLFTSISACSRALGLMWGQPQVLTNLSPVVKYFIAVWARVYTYVSRSVFLQHSSCCCCFLG